MICSQINSLQRLPCLRSTPISFRNWMQHTCAKCEAQAPFQQTPWNRRCQSVALTGKTLWSDNISLMDAKLMETSRLLVSRQLAPPNRKLVVDAVVGAAKALCLI
ncbi:MAG: hypothetical protein KAX62_02985 [Xylophilus sp.]|nr:hypothetical protein [Xylophilus sp.]